MGVIGLAENLRVVLSVAVFVAIGESPAVGHFCGIGIRILESPDTGQLGDSTGVVVFDK